MQTDRHTNIHSVTNSPVNTPTVSPASGTPHSPQSFLRLSSVPPSTQVFMWHTKRIAFIRNVQTSLYFPHGIKTPKITAMLLLVIREQTVKCVSQSVSQTVRQSVSQSIRESVTKAISQSVRQSGNQSINQLESQSRRQSVSQSDS